jgi:preprotein translocase subunit SecE
MEKLIAAIDLLPSAAVCITHASDDETNNFLWSSSKQLLNENYLIIIITGLIVLYCVVTTFVCSVCVIVVDVLFLRMVRI